LINDIKFIYYDKLQTTLSHLIKVDADPLIRISRLLESICL
jgi:hypothetical protein